VKTASQPMSLSLIIPPPGSWQAYRSALQHAETYWISTARLVSHGRVFTTPRAISWQETISLGHALIQGGNWLNLSQRDIAILFGYVHQGIDYGLLANTTIAVRARQAFNQNQNGVRQIFQNTLQALLNIPVTQVVHDIPNAISTLTGFVGFGTTIATRLLALTRPDCCVSVTALCARNFAISAMRDGTWLSREVPTLGNAWNYPRLLGWVHKQPWYIDATPNDEVWSMRAALLDAFVYDP
jgi:hypothetical protein